MRNTNPNVGIELLDFLMHGIPDPLGGQGFIGVLIMVLLLEVVAKVDLSEGAVMHLDLGCPSALARGSILFANKGRDRVRDVVKSPSTSHGHGHLFGCWIHRRVLSILSVAHPLENFRYKRKGVECYVLGPATEKWLVGATAAATL